ncbi:MAG: DUF4199 domain-containing protein [Bacteroidales bacterium]|jgi:disulfide bond formation protein DsbB
MNENAPTNTKFALNNGTLIAIVLIFYSLLLWVLGVDRENWLQYFSYLVMLVGVVLAVKQYRDKNNGFLSYGKAFSNGFLTLLFAAIITSIYVFIFFQFIAPGEVAAMIEKAEEQMVERNPNLSDEEVSVAMGYAKMFMTPWAMAVMVLFFNTIAALVIAAIVAAFMKKEEQQFV